MAIGEVGSLTRGGFSVGEIIRIEFTEPIEDAVVHLSSTNFGGNEFSLRVVSVDDNGFNFILEEWEDEDGPHPVSEQINWIAVEEGIHKLPDGRIIEAGTTTATTTGSTVDLNGGFSAPPAVLTNVASTNDSDVVDSDPSDVTATGFVVELEEGSLSDGVNTGETVGYIAIGVGGDGTAGYATVQDGLTSGNTTFALGGTLTDGIILAETQTDREDDAGNVVINNVDSATGATGDISLRFDEETGDGESAHGAEIVGIVGFEQGLIMCLAAGTKVATEDEEVTVETLSRGALVRTGDGGLAVLRHIFKRHLSSEELRQQPHFKPIRIMQGALGNGLPRRDLLVSRQHRMLVRSSIAGRMFGDKEVLVSAHHLTALPGVFIDHDVDAVTYVHLLFDAHQIVFAEGAPTESLYLGKQSLSAMPSAAKEEIVALFPELTEVDAVWPSVRLIPNPKQQRHLVERHRKNEKSVLSDRN